MTGQTTESMQRYFADIRHYPVLTREEELELAQQAKDGQEKAMSRLVECNLRFVVKVAGEYRNFGVPFEDLVSEGNLGLIEAIQRFDPARGIKLISWAVWWIRRAIRNALAEQTHVVRLPDSQLRRMRQARVIERDLTDELGREPSLDEIASKMKKNKADLNSVYLQGIRMSSLDEPMGDADADTSASMLEDENLVSIEDQLVRQEAADRVRELCGQLDEKECTVIRGRFGIDGEQAQTLDEVGKRVGHSREGVRLIERRAIRRLGKRLAAATYDAPLPAA